MDPHWTLQGRRALITGATRGIGEAIARQFLALGAEVFLVARSEDQMDKTLAAYRRQGLAAHGTTADVSLPEGRRKIIREVRALWDGLDILVNNAGVNLRKPTLEYTLEDYHSLMATNAESAWDLCRYCHPFLKRSEGAAIVNISSVSGCRALLTSTLAYAMSKAAMEQMTRFLAAEWGPEDIRVNAVEPFYVDTPLVAAVLRDQKTRENLLAHTPLGRLAEADEIARVVAFLAMPASSFVTGACVPVDGGFLSLGFRK